MENENKVDEEVVLSEAVPVLEKEILIADNGTVIPLAICKWCSVEQVKKCFFCKSNYCTLHSSRYSPNFCQDCFKNLTIIIDKYIKTSEDYDPLDETVTIKRESCDRLKLDGPDYPFLSLWINNLSNDDMKTVYEFHYFVLKMIEHENETRKIIKLKRLRESPTPVLTSTTTTTKTTRTSKPVDIRAKLKAMGLADDIVEAMIKAGTTI